MTIPAAPDLKEATGPDLQEATSPAGNERRRWLAPPPLRGIRAAFVFLTRLPLGGFPYRREDWTWAAAHAPLVGLVVGGMTGVGYRLFLPIGALPASFLAIALSLLVTGAFHEDGLADTSDALGGGYDEARVLAILKDSRIGTFGGAALVVSIAGRAALLAQLGPAGLWALPLVGCLARTPPIWLMAVLPYVSVTPAAKSRDVARGGVPQAIVATLWFAAASVVATMSRWMTVGRAGALAVTMVAVAGLTGWRYRRRLGGITGDFLGATEQVAELCAFCVLAWKS